MAVDTTALKFRLLQEGLGLALLHLVVAAAGGFVQAQEVLGNLHLLDVSDGVVTLSYPTVPPWQAYCVGL